MCMYDIILAKQRDRMVPLPYMSPNPEVGNSLIFCCRHNAHNAAILTLLSSFDYDDGQQGRLSQEVSDHKS
jgi:hypothetical protein